MLCPCEGPCQLQNPTPEVRRHGSKARGQRLGAEAMPLLTRAKARYARCELTLEDSQKENVHHNFFFKFCLLNKTPSNSLMNFFPPTENAGSKSRDFFLFCSYVVGFYGLGPFQRRESLRSHLGLSAELSLLPGTRAADMCRSQAGRASAKASQLTLPEGTWTSASHSHPRHFAIRCTALFSKSELTASPRAPHS